MINWRKQSNVDRLFEPYIYANKLNSNKIQSHTVTKYKNIKFILLHEQNIHFIFQKDKSDRHTWSIHAGPYPGAHSWWNECNSLTNNHQNYARIWTNIQFVWEYIQCSHRIDKKQNNKRMLLSRNIHESFMPFGFLSTKTNTRDYIISQSNESFINSFSQYYPESLSFLSYQIPRVLPFSLMSIQEVIFPLIPISNPFIIIIWWLTWTRKIKIFQSMHSDMQFNIIHSIKIFIQCKIFQISPIAMIPITSNEETDDIKFIIHWYIRRTCMMKKQSNEERLWTHPMVKD